VAATKDKAFRPYPTLYILFHWQSKVIDLVGPSLPSFLCSFHNIVKLDLVNIVEILLARR